ncbi:MAG: hypothetical protein JNM09_09770 [Blastocatellia bacterium]|nr:hypothetical protein [Blastocatellia bacterium]
MADSNTSLTNAKSLVIEKGEFDYITLEQADGKATTVKFQVMNPSVTIGDVLVILDGTEILFHGMLSRMEDGWATASDPRGSLLPATTD